MTEHLSTSFDQIRTRALHYDRLDHVLSRRELAALLDVAEAAQAHQDSWSQEDQALITTTRVALRDALKKLPQDHRPITQ